VTRPSRREFLRSGGLALAGLGVVPGAWAGIFAPEVIEMRSDPLGSRVWFDPIGLYVEPGTTIRWIVRQNVHTTTAYHPQNDRHPLRIPGRALPWNSGYLVQPGDHFDVRLTVPGVYDYYCMPHEIVGMVGRIVVGQAPGSGAKDWRHVPDAAQRAFPSVARILTERRVHPAPAERR
jgi:plastocyanin